MRRYLLQSQSSLASAKPLPFKVFIPEKILNLHPRLDLLGLGYRAETGPLLVPYECHMTGIRAVGGVRGFLNILGPELSTITATGSAC